MGFFNFIKKKLNSTNFINNNQSVKFTNSENLCNENAIKKHLIIYLLTNPSSCFYICRDVKEEGTIEFIFEKGKLRLIENRDVVPAFVFTWLTTNVRKNQDDFVRVFEILNRSHAECYGASLFMDGATLFEKVKYYFKEFSLANNPEEVKASLEWTYIDIVIMHKFFLETADFLVEHIHDEEIVPLKSISECTCIRDLQNNILYSLKNKNLNRQQL